MRLHERSMVKVQLAARMTKVGALGGRHPAFSQEMQTVRATVLPEAGGLARHESGLACKERLRVLLPVDTKVCAGDRLTMGEKAYLVQDVHRWTAHIELECEAMP